MRTHTIHTHTLARATKKGNREFANFEVNYMWNKIHTSTHTQTHTNAHKRTQYNPERRKMRK